LYWANPFCTKKRISLKASNFDSERLKVNDKLGNPIMISIIHVWRATNTCKSVFIFIITRVLLEYKPMLQLENQQVYIPYIILLTKDWQKILHCVQAQIVSKVLEKEIEERLAIAEIKVLEARIEYLAYAQEIANVMLKRQQAAVSMVQLTLEQLGIKNIVEFR
tara:strand:+ start:2554 stop:3045 length:492 start_codon:yes stop_codon:yes gene_type:complete